MRPPEVKPKAEPPKELMLPTIGASPTPTIVEHAAPPTPPPAPAQPTPTPVQQPVVQAPPKVGPAPPAPQPANNAPDSREGRVLARIAKYRRFPASARSTHEQGVAFIHFRMDRAGHFLSASLVRSSGFADLDQAALDTLRRADPLPPIPADRPDQLELSVPIEFYIADEDFGVRSLPSMWLRSLRDQELGGTAAMPAIFAKTARAKMPPSVHSALVQATAPAEVEPPKPEPAISIRASVRHDHIVCLEDGKKLKMLKRYLRTNYNMSSEEYRAKWGLPRDYPMVAPAYAEQRKELAKKIGLGRKPSSPPAKSKVKPKAVSGEALKKARGRPAKPKLVPQPTEA